MPDSTPPPPPKRDPCRRGIFDLPSAVRARVYAHYFTYPHGLHLHLIYSGHFPRPRHVFEARDAYGDDLLTPRAIEDDEGGDDDYYDDDDEWPFPTEAPFAATSWLFSTAQYSPLLPDEDRETWSAHDADADAAIVLSPDDECFGAEMPRWRPSTRQRFRGLHAQLPPRFHAEAALLRTCRAVHAEAWGYVWKCNAVHLVTDAVFDDDDSDDDGPRDGGYHLHLGVVPAQILRTIRTLSLPGSVVAQLPSRSERVDDMIVQRRVWGVMEREMAGLRRVEVGLAGGWEVRRFLAWVLDQEEAQSGRCWVVVEGGEVAETRGGTAGSSQVGARDIEEYVCKEKRVGGGYSSGSLLAGRMGLPKELRVVKVMMVLPKGLRDEFEALEWSDMRAVQVGKKMGMIIRRGIEVPWSAVVYEMRRRQETLNEAEGLTAKLHARYAGTRRYHEGESLSDKVYGKLRLLG